MNHRFVIALTGILSLGICGSTRATTYDYAGDPEKGSISPTSQDWKGADGKMAWLESSPKTTLQIDTLKIDPVDVKQLTISVSPEFITAGRLVVGVAGSGWANIACVVLTGSQPLTLEGSGGKPGEFLLESSRNVQRNDASDTGLITFVPLLAPNGLLFGGAGQGPEVLKGSLPDGHRMIIAAGFKADGACTKVGPIEVRLHGVTKLGGPLVVQKGSFNVAAGSEPDKPTLFDIKSMRVELDARVQFSAPDGHSVAMTLLLGQSKGDALITCHGVLEGLQKVALNLLTSDGKPPLPGTYCIIKRDQLEASADEFAHVTLNGSALPTYCRMDYDSAGFTVDLVVRKK